MGWPYDQYAFAYTSDKYKYIGVPLDEHEELYDLVADPDETENIAATSGEEIAAIKERLKRYFEIDVILDLVPTKEVILNEKQRKMLKALGYLND